MSEVKNIKGIDDETWAEFKSLAAKNKMKAGEMFREIIRDYKGRTKNVWDDIFAHKAVLSKKQYDEFESRIREMRKAPWRI